MRCLRPGVGHRRIQGKNRKERERKSDVFRHFVLLLTCNVWFRAFVCVVKPGSFFATSRCANQRVFLFFFFLTKIYLLIFFFFPSFHSQAAAAAKRALHDTLIFDKAIQIQFAKDKSDVVVRSIAQFPSIARSLFPSVNVPLPQAKADGTFVRRTRAKRAAGSVRMSLLIVCDSLLLMSWLVAQVNREADPEKRAAKKRALEAKNRVGVNAPGSKTESKNESLPPNKLLFADNLPGTTLAISPLTDTSLS